MTTNNFDPNDFFTDESGVENGRVSQVAGNIGAWILHLAKVAFLLYSSVHAINASLKYAGSSDWAKFAQIGGIIVLEATLFGLYLAWHNGKITGPAQSVAAGITYMIGFFLACLGVVADSQINGGLALSSWLAWYLHWGLPISPAVMAFGALLTSELAPDKLRQRQEAQERDRLADARFKAYLANERANLEEAKMAKAIQLASRRAVLTELGRVYTSPEVQRAIAQTATANAPALLRAAGIHVDDGPAVNVIAAPMAAPTAMPVTETAASAPPSPTLPAAEQVIDADSRRRPLGFELPDNPHEVARWLAENPQLALMLRDHYVAGSDEAAAEADEKAANFTSRPDGRS
jgi:hypothetical protein